MRYFAAILLLLVLTTGFSGSVAGEEPPVAEIPDIILSGIAFDVQVIFPDHPAGRDTVILLVDNQEIPVVLKDGRGSFSHTPGSGHERIQIALEQQVVSVDYRSIPLWMSVLPPLLAILIALILREVFIALFAGIWVGTTIISFFQGKSLLVALFSGVFSIMDDYVVNALNDTGHLSIIVFSLMIGGMVQLISDNGGMQGVVNRLARHAHDRRSGQFVTWLLGMAIFFDDYANTLVVGNTMRPVTDRLKISREKLAYIVDSTAAPIAAIAFVTTWIGAELSYIQDGISALNLNETAYDVFLNSLQYSFYPVFALAFVVILLGSGRDFGPMLRAERLMIGQGVSKIHPGNSPTSGESGNSVLRPRGRNAVIPVIVIVLGTLTGLLITGWQVAGWHEDKPFFINLSGVIGNADSYKALLWSSLAGVITAVLLTTTQKILGLKESVSRLVSGFKVMLPAVIILVLAWSIALMTKLMHTADFISGIMIYLNVSPYIVPAITFILSALIAFSTGSSWGTMAILYPLILPGVWFISQENGLPYDTSISLFHNVVSAVLAGSVLGDHCSPISDTTILSSLASSCNHIEHVRTQLPYALLVGLVSLFLGTIPAAYGVSSFLLFPAGLGIFWILVRFLGKKTEAGSSVIKPDEQKVN
ncbi:MAG: Na+/H+ antiporter NhaC family protein [Bacteroidales bacterium]